jgi:hypothetical protein
MADSTPSVGAISSYSFDHIIILLDTPEFESPPEWLTKHFTIIEGGTHAGMWCYYQASLLFSYVSFESSAFAV